MLTYPCCQNFIVTSNNENHVFPTRVRVYKNIYEYMNFLRQVNIQYSSNPPIRHVLYSLTKWITSI
jgi:hypothetical protein